MNRTIDQLVEHVRRVGDITLPLAVEYLVGEDKAWGGGLAPYVDSMPNTYLGCVNLSETGLTALRAIQEDGRLTPVACNLLCYLVDGARIPRMPIAKRPPRGGYKTSHWVPVRFVPNSETAR